ncbi:unnamed protein product, partial [Discosporangium mesarthrocarpum]
MAFHSQKKRPPSVAGSGSPPRVRRRSRASSFGGSNIGGNKLRMGVYARLPPSCPYVGNFHYAPSAGNRAYSFFEGQIVSERETERLHKIRTNPLTGNFHSRPGHYSKLHGLHNFRKQPEPVSMERIIQQIKTSFKGLGYTTGLGSALPRGSSFQSRKRSSLSGNVSRDGSRVHLMPSNWAVVSKEAGAVDADMAAGFRTGAGDTVAGGGGDTPTGGGADDMGLKDGLLPGGGPTVGGKPLKPGQGLAKGRYKYWEAVDTNLGRFGSSLDDGAVRGATTGAGAPGSLSKPGGSHQTSRQVHWSEQPHPHHHHHYSPADTVSVRTSTGGGEDGWASVGLGDPLIGDATAMLRHLYFRERPWGTQQKGFLEEMGATGGSRAGGSGSRTRGGRRGGIDSGRGISSSSSRPGHSGMSSGGAGGRGRGGLTAGVRQVVGPGSASNYDRMARLRRGSLPILRSSEVRTKGQRLPGSATQVLRKGSLTGHGWESHTLKAQKRKDEYLQGRERLAPDMRQDMVLDKQISLAYDVSIEEVLGAGSYGTVHPAVHRSTRRQVAIKYVKKKYLFSDAEKACVEREIQIQQRLVNNHIIRLYEIYQSPEHLYLVQERAPCGSLEELLFLRGRLSELDAKRLVKQLLDGVSYLHASGVVHCDLKPANILLSDLLEGDLEPVASRLQHHPHDSLNLQPAAPASMSGLVVKICDFGHARKVPDTRYYKFTGDIHKIPFHLFKHTGTEGFVAREVLVQEPYGKAADMWSVGCMLYKVLSGRMPWIPSRACLQRPLAMSGPLWSKVSQEAKDLVKELLEMDQNLRLDASQALHHAWFEGIDHCAIMPTSAPGGPRS